MMRVTKFISASFLLLFMVVWMGCSSHIPLTVEDDHFAHAENTHASEGHDNDAIDGHDSNCLDHTTVSMSHGNRDLSGNLLAILPTEWTHIIQLMGQMDISERHTVAIADPPNISLTSREMVIQLGNVRI